MYMYELCTYWVYVLKTVVACKILSFVHIASARTKLNCYSSETINRCCTNHLFCYGVTLHRPSSKLVEVQWWLVRVAKRMHRCTVGLAWGVQEHLLRIAWCKVGHVCLSYNVLLQVDLV